MVKSMKVSHLTPAKTDFVLIRWTNFECFCLHYSVCISVLKKELKKNNYFYKFWKTLL